MSDIEAFLIVATVTVGMFGLVFSFMLMLGFWDKK